MPKINPYLRQILINSIPCLRLWSKKAYPDQQHVPVYQLYGSAPPPGRLHSLSLKDLLKWIISNSEIFSPQVLVLLVLFLKQFNESGMVLIDYDWTSFIW